MVSSAALVWRLDNSLRATGMVGSVALALYKKLPTTCSMNFTPMSSSGGLVSSGYVSCAAAPYLLVVFPTDCVAGVWVSRACI